MPPSDSILAELSQIANHWRGVAVAWHVITGTLMIGLVCGWRPSHRAAGFLLSTPLMSVSIAAWASGNRFNAAVFAGLLAVLVVAARGLPDEPVHPAPPIGFVPGALLLAFGWMYPHFLQADRWWTYTYAAPLGVLPCPTLAAMIGATLMFRLSVAPSWALNLATAGIIYGIVGTLVLAIPLDLALLAGSVLLAGTSVASDPRFNRSVRADAGERARRLPGDHLIPQPSGSLTHGITIRCPRRQVWPWLAQMGAGSRAGWYSYDRLDNDGHPSAVRVVPELQSISIGTVFPALPGQRDGFKVLAFAPEEFLVLGWPSPDGSPLVTWAFVLGDARPPATRLLVRARAARGYRFRGLPSWASLWVVTLVHFVMQRKQLLGIASRAELSIRAAKYVAIIQAHPDL